MTRKHFNNLHKICRICNEKIKQIEKNNSIAYVFPFTKSGKMWRYYMSVWRRMIKEMDNDIKEHERTT